MDVGESIREVEVIPEIIPVPSPGETLQPADPAKKETPDDSSLIPEPTVPAS